MATNIMQSSTLLTTTLKQAKVLCIASSLTCFQLVGMQNDSLQQNLELRDQSKLKGNQNMNNIDITKSALLSLPRDESFVKNLFTLYLLQCDKNEVQTYYDYLTEFRKEIGCKLKEIELVKIKIEDEIRKLQKQAEAQQMAITSLEEVMRLINIEITENINTKLSI